MEEKKVRCTGCRIVILLTPDPDEPNGLRVKIPRKSDKPKQMSEGKKRVLLIGLLSVLVIIVLIGLYITFSNPPDRGAVEGMVSHEGAALEKGTIKFVSQDAPIPRTVSAPIVRGRYSLRASQGPAIGKNKVEISSDGTEIIAPRFGEKSEYYVDIRVGANPRDIDTLAK